MPIVPGRAPTPSVAATPLAVTVPSFVLMIPVFTSTVPPFVPTTCSVVTDIVVPDVMSAVLVSAGV